MTFLQRQGADVSDDGDAKTWTSHATPGDGDAARRAFLRMVSHELRTPLNSIIGFADILHGQLYGPLGSPEYVEYAGIIRDSGARLLHLFNNVLELMRLEGGGGFAPAPEAVQPWLEEAIARRREAAAVRQIELRLRPLDAPVIALVDPKGLLTCLDHLIGNAIDFTAAGDSVEIAARREGRHVLISVYNRGPAPAPDDIERLMQPFEQDGQVLNRSHDGAGLGWPIVRLTAQAMGGEFGVATRTGEALRAVLRFPAA
ncbi:MAG TPA: HAMP domain-containing sensor histidine kinase [Asticcacaulis sp.]|jgi:signal transduction histidine kinase|nr:HAMP domain-containing sensor histidine kinase [Asticcacaulis sp.]